MLTIQLCVLVVLGGGRVVGGGASLLRTATAGERIPSSSRRFLASRTQNIDKTDLLCQLHGGDASGSGGNLVAHDFSFYYALGLLKNSQQIFTDRFTLQQRLFESVKSKIPLCYKTQQSEPVKREENGEARRRRSLEVAQEVLAARSSIPATIDQRGRALEDNGRLLSNTRRRLAIISVSPGSTEYDVGDCPAQVIQQEILVEDSESDAPNCHLVRGSIRVLSHPGDNLDYLIAASRDALEKEINVLEKWKEWTRQGNGDLTSLAFVRYVGDSLTQVGLYSSLLGGSGGMDDAEDRVSPEDTEARVTVIVNSKLPSTASPTASAQPTISLLPTVSPSFVPSEAPTDSLPPYSSAPSVSAVPSISSVPTIISALPTTSTPPTASASPTTAAVGRGIVLTTGDNAEPAAGSLALILGVGVPFLLAFLLLTFIAKKRHRAKTNAPAGDAETRLYGTGDPPGSYHEGLYHYLPQSGICYLSTRCKECLKTRQQFLSDGGEYDNTVQYYNAGDNIVIAGDSDSSSSSSGGGSSLAVDGSTEATLTNNQGTSLSYVTTDGTGSACCAIAPKLGEQLRTQNVQKCKSATCTLCNNNNNMDETCWQSPQQQQQQRCGGTVFLQVEDSDGDDESVVVEDDAAAAASLDEEEEATTGTVAGVVG